MSNDSRRIRNSPAVITGVGASALRTLPVPVSAIANDAERISGQYTPPEPIELTN